MVLYNEHKGWFSISELSFTRGHLAGGSHYESLLGLQSTGLFMIVKQGHPTRI